MKDALAAAKRRKALLQTVNAATPSPATPGPKKRNLKGDTPGGNTVASSSTTASSGEKVTPDPKAIRTDAEPRVLFEERFLNKQLILYIYIYMRHVICSIYVISEICV